MNESTQHRMFEIYWDDLTDEAKDRMNELWHENIDLSPIAIVDIEDPEEDSTGNRKDK